MDNIVERFGRNGNREFIRFLGISKGSANEIKSQLYRLLDRNYVIGEEFQITYS
jgi:four helix bundle protein